MLSDVSVILPTYNRASFLPQAFASIASQTWANWDLVVIDDGSTDGTRDVVHRLASSCTRKLEYLYQSNRGAAAARNVGIEHAHGKYVAFFDSDDVWLPGYLERNVRALDANPDVDWVFSPCRVVELASGRQVEANTFWMAGRPRPFLELKTESRESGLKVIVDPHVLEYQLTDGMSCGPQNSVCRRSVLAQRRFLEHVHVVEDQLLAMCVLADRRRFAYFADDPQVIYYVHDGNWSFAAKENAADKYVDVFGGFVEALERFRRELPLTRREARALRRRLAGEYFWHLGYNGLWQAGRRREAVRAYRRSLHLWPWDIARWKTFLLAQARLSFGSAASS